MTRIVAIAGVVIVLAVTVITTAYAGEKGIEAGHPWARPTIADRPGVVYFRLSNKTGQLARLVGIRTPVAEAAELHTSTMTNGVMNMRRVEALEIPAGGRVILEPGGYHIMLLGLDKPLKTGMKFPMTLVFAGAESLEIEVKVKKNGSDDDDDDDDDKDKKDPLSGRKIKDLTPSPD